MTDKLSVYESYYAPDSYDESLHRIYRTGINEYLKLFTEDRFQDIQLVLEFSRIAKDHNINCQREFVIILKCLEMVVSVTSGEDNRFLVNKFETLYQKMIKKIKNKNKKLKIFNL